MELRGERRAKKRKGERAICMERRRATKKNMDKIMWKVYKARRLRRGKIK